MIPGRGPGTLVPVETIPSPALALGLILFILLALAAYACWRFMVWDLRPENVPRPDLDSKQRVRMRVELARMGANESALLERVRSAQEALAAAMAGGRLDRARAFVSDGVASRLRWRPPLMDETARLDRVMLVTAQRGERFEEVSALLKGRRDGRDAEEVWTFLRAPGARALERPGSIEGSCPSCGGALDIADAAKCPACGSYVNSGDFDWVLFEITERSCWRGRDYKLGVKGWADLAARDPALTPQALEDRAAGVFWRTLEPRLRRRALLHACDVTRIEDPGGDWTWAHILVEWTDGVNDQPEPRRDLLIFKRAADALTDPRQGLRTERCASCGSSRGWRDEAACAYCGKPLEDPSRDWTLESIKPYGRV